MKVIPRTALLQALDDRTMEDMQSFNPESISNTLWAFAALRYKLDRQFLRKAVEHIHENIDDYCPRSTSMMLTAFAKMNVRPISSLFVAVQKRFVATMSEYNSLALASLLWAMHKLDEMPETDFLEAVKVQAADRLAQGEFTRREAGMTLRALNAFQELPAGELHRALEDRISHG